MGCIVLTILRFHQQNLIPGTSDLDWQERRELFENRKHLFGMF